ncbi:25S rRNA (adenine645-N1)-methyltransferase [Recurvomyces mirabilis]|uniref:Ribosomal RNA-processing protein 8 n=1 Tax=Recurvomyces mirabilis TaxID=574656 RepID=A0AAE1C545_9PEZI|nr:25S rRNA (adenine645-N1)-methyltransferase [Recurvomyces mirabilis]KAK5151782.1 25S rRNA (adenine645-N1)-methyltransferase [Recurvomyces mirabilis]
MFAVKGWSVDNSTLKPQLEVFSKATNAKEPAAPGEGKKRKRKRNEAPAAQTEQDVGKLWEQHIEGKDPLKAKKKLEKAKKRQKLDQPKEAAQTHGVVAKAPEVTSQQDGVKKMKKDKKSKKSGQPPTEKNAAPSGEQANAVVKAAPPPIPQLPATAKLTPMQAAMRQKLVSARFRHLNQTLYTAPSATALSLFDQNPEMFEDYHAGFRQQVEVWPENPLDNFVATVRTRGAVKPPRYHEKKGGKGRAPPAPEVNAEEAGKPTVLPRTHGTAILADLGCGDARLAQTLSDSNDLSTLTLKIHSFDLHSPSPLVTKADIANLPLGDGSIDVAIFCLALMGTNWISFIEEAYRVLHWKGELWIAEIKSRFGRVGKGGKVVEHSVGSKRKAAVMKKAAEAKAKVDEEVDEQSLLRTEVDGQEVVKQEETDVTAFVEVLKRRGFVLKDGERSVDLGNKMFVKMEFVKAAVPTRGKRVADAERERERMGGGVPAQEKFKKKKFLAEEGKEGEEVVVMNMNKH